MAVNLALVRPYLESFVQFWLTFTRTWTYRSKYVQSDMYERQLIATDIQEIPSHGIFLHMKLFHCVNCQMLD